MNKIGIALSGGGQRAAAFHLGVLKKLHELKLLEMVHTISAISGGSIIAAYYLLQKDNFSEFYSSFKKKLTVDLELRSIFNIYFGWRIGLLVLLFCGYIYSFVTSNTALFLILLVPLGFLPILFKLFPTSKSLQRTYDKIFYDNFLLKDLPDTPYAIFNSTNLQTGTLMTFSKNKINDSSYIFKYGHNPEINIDKIPISFAVTASTAFSPFISPLQFDNDLYKDLETLKNKKINPQLVDGGLYDNQGLYKLTKEDLDILICSDASAPYDRENYSSNNPFGLLMRTINILMKRIRSFQYINILFESKDDHEIAYFSIEWEYKKCIENFAELIFQNKIKDKIIDAHRIPEDFLKFNDEIEKKEKIVQIIRFIKEKIGFSNIIKTGLSSPEILDISKINTRLFGLTEKQVEKLINHGCILTELQLKLYCPSLKI